MKFKGQVLNRYIINRSIFHIGSVDIFLIANRATPRSDLSRSVAKVIRSEKRYGNVSTGKLLALLFSSFQFRDVDKVLSFRISVKEVFGFSRAVALLRDYKDNNVLSHILPQLPSAIFAFAEIW